MDSRFIQPRRHTATSLALVIVCALTGCTRTVYVPQVETRTEYRDRVTHDTTIVERERIERVKGDTVFVDVMRNVYRVTIQRDTVVRSDTVVVTRDVVKVQEVERKKTKFESWTQNTGIVAIGVLVVWFVWYVRKISKELV